MNSQTRKWNSDAAKAQAKERQDQVAAAIKKVGKAKHTPGPWIVEKPTFNHKNVAYLIMPKGQAIARVNASIDSEPEEHLANARLIAAAPDLLLLLEAARDALVDCAPAKFKQPGWDILGLLHRIDHAIAKAKGESA